MVEGVVFFGGGGFTSLRGLDGHLNKAHRINGATRILSTFWRSDVPSIRKLILGGG